MREAKIVITTVAGVEVEIASYDLQELKTLRSVIDPSKAKVELFERNDAWEPVA